MLTRPQLDQLIAQLRAADNPTASDLAAVAEACLDTLLALDGIARIRPTVGNHNEVYRQAARDALDALLPAAEQVAKRVGWSGVGWW